jgi:hypothetical protein
MRLKGRRANGGWSLLVILALCTGKISHARSRAVQLVYEVDPGVTGCPDEAALKREVESRLGSNPWRPNTSRTVLVVVTRARGALQARIQLQKKDGSILGTRILRAGQGECRELGAAMALAISIAIDPKRASRPNHTPQVTVHKQAPADRVLEPPPSSTQLALSLGGMLALGTAPDPTGGLELQVALRWRAYALAIEGRFDFPASADLQTGRISALLSGGSLLGCAHHRMLFGCAVFTAAALRGRGHELVNAREVTLPYIAAGLRGGIEYSIISRWSLRAHGEILAPFGRLTFEDSSTKEPFWSTPDLSGSIALSAAYKFF